MSFAELQIPQEAITTIQAMDWFNAVKEFRNAESKYLSQPGVFDLTLDEHRQAVSELIAIGEKIVLDD